MRMKFLIAFFVCGLIDVSRSETCNVHPNAVNLALYGRVCQSSTFPEVPRPGPERGVDGISETNHTVSPCTITNLEEKPFWSVDMEENYFVGKVIIVLRQDDCKKCMLGAEIRVGDSPDHENKVCATITDVSQPLLTFSCKGMQGRYVTVIHANGYGIISFCEIKIYQHIPTNTEQPAN